MKKIAYAVYVCGVITLLVFAKTEVLTADTVSLIFLAVIFLLGLYFFGGNAPMRQYPVENLATLKDTANRRNAPSVILPFLILGDPYLSDYL